MSCVCVCVCMHVCMNCSFDTMHVAHDVSYSKNKRTGVHTFSCGLVWGPNTPLEIQRAGRNAFRCSPKLQVLMEQWASAQGVWTQSDFFLQIKEKKKNRRFGCRVWLTRSEMTAKYGSTTIAQQIIEAKEIDKEASKTQIRAHPDMHGVQTEDSHDTHAMVFLVSQINVQLSNVQTCQCAHFCECNL